jgi:non-ribosomal peptide synthetase component F
MPRHGDQGFTLRWLLLALVLVATAGCARYYWSKPGSTAEEFNRDSAACARESSPNEASRMQGIVQLDVYRASLTARGYTRDKQLEPVPPTVYRGIE